MAVAGFYVFNEAVANDAAAVAGKEYVTVPNVQGRHKDEAKKLLQDVGLSMGAPSPLVSSKVAPDYVMFQRPAPGEVVRAGRRVYPTVSMGTANVTIPSVVNLTEAEARKRRHQIRILRWPFHDNDRAQTERETRGHIKVVVDKKGKVLGVTIVGAQAGELIATWILAIVQGMNIRALTGVVLPYPTLSEIGKRAAIDFFTPSLTRPLLRRIIAWLRIFG